MDTDNANIETKSHEQLVEEMNANLRKQPEPQPEQPTGEIVVAPEDLAEIQSAQKRLNDKLITLGLLEAQYAEEHEKLVASVAPLRQEMEIIQRRLGNRYKIPIGSIFDIDTGRITPPK